ncbi:putative carbohydrate esterase [Forsythia ovata]|uniref:Carbohydrate esterase n=1 Tax=Forsythia ovata TaxID=205694 RepID=A0ABD1QQH6_9LAMI
MAGRGGVDKSKIWDGVVPPECSPDPSKIYRLNARLQWEPALEPLHHVIDDKKTCGVGPGMSFANAAKESMGVVGLVPCAVGGTAIKEWGRGTPLYENMVKRAATAVQDGAGEIKALLWYQGESDALTQHDAESYKENMETLVHNVRADLNLPSLPVIQVAIGSVKDKYAEKIREIQKGIYLPNVVCVDAMGLKLKEDNLHLTTEAQAQLGRMLADAYFANFGP